MNQYRMPNKPSRVQIIIFSVLGGLILVSLASAIWLAMCYNWCPYGSSMQLTRKTGASSVGQYASDSEKGVVEDLRGPGRHFLNPWTYSVKNSRDVVIKPWQIATVKNNIGKNLPSDRFLANPDEKGTQKMVLTPGVWRINEFGQKVSVVPATVVKPGYVGVQTLREGENKGILPTVLQAGYYNINPVEISVESVEIGYRVWDVHTRGITKIVTLNGKQTRVKAVEEGSGVSFPLADGKQMHLDFTVVWGIFPADAPRIVREYGTLEMVEKKIIEPQVLSICKNAGSNLTTREFIEGTSREQFQQKVTEELQKMGEQKGIHFLIALVRGFHPDTIIKDTIQERMLAEEEKITLKVEQQRDKVAAELERAKRIVDVAVKDFDAQTLALLGQEREQGTKTADQIKAQADRSVAGLLRKAEETKAQSVKIIGQADADVIEAMKKAEAKKLELLIDAYGGADQYNLATFAESLPQNLKIEYRYAGEGTLWTEMKASLENLAAKKILKSAEPKKK